jgi:acetyltransferase-like isoleucine patch superfamily enzyme
VSIGAVVKHGVVIGADSVLGANSYLHADLPGGRVAYGSPARVVRERRVGDRYLD